MFDGCRIIDDTSTLKSHKYHQCYQYGEHSQFYKECILDFQKLNRKGRVMKNDGSEIIWGNEDILFQGQLLMFAHWSKSGISYIKDIIKNGKIQQNEIYHRLKNKTGYMFEMQTIKTCFSQGCLKSLILNENGNPQDCAILNSTFRLPNRLHKPLNKSSSKDLYSIVLYNKTVQVPSKLYWLHKFDNIDDKWMVWCQMNLVNELLPNFSNGNYFMVKLTLRVTCKGCHYLMENVNYAVYM